MENSINLLIFARDTHCLYFEARTEFSYTVYMKPVIRRDKMLHELNSAQVNV